MMELGIFFLFSMIELHSLYIGSAVQCFVNKWLMKTCVFCEEKNYLGKRLLMIDATATSPVTLTEVRSISSGLSIPRIKAKLSAGIPMEVRTMARIT